MADISRERNKADVAQVVVERDASTKDFYNRFDPLTATEKDIAEFEKWKKGLKPEELALLNEDLHLYELQFKNIGGLVMPVILEWEYADGTKEVDRIPAELWRTTHEVSKERYHAAEAAFGQTGVVDIIHGAGAYLGVSMLLNAFEVPAPTPAP